MASPLEQFVHNVRTLSSQGNFRDLVELLCKSTDILLKNGQHLDAVLDCLQQHSLGMLSVLIIKLSLPPPPAGGAVAGGSGPQLLQQGSSTAAAVPGGASTTAAPASASSSGGPAAAAAAQPTQPADYQEIRFTQVQEFITNCVAEQIRYAPDAFSELCHMLTKQLVDSKTPLRGIELLSIAIQKLQTDEGQLTLVHADLCQLCLLAKFFKPALKFLDVDVTSLYIAENVQFDAKYFLLYYYYGGMIYAAVKNYERALYFFEVVISTPAMAVSHIMLEAYKKYLLISLILHGKVSAIPKYVSQVVGRFIKPLSQAYHDLANIYATNSTEELRQTANKHTDIFTRDGNVGLTKQVISSLYKKNIQRLTKTFLTLSLSDVASRVQLSGPSEAEKYVLHMIEDGEIFATINQKDGMVIFHDDPEKYNSPRMLCRLEDEMTLSTDLDRRIQKMEEEILVNPQYVKKSCGATDEDLSGSGGQGSKLSYLM